MWVGQGGPFGIRAAPASHGIATTDHRFIISANRHIAGEPPTLVSIPFSAVLCVESGSALMLGWLVIRFMEAGSARSATVLYRALGRKHCLTAVRAYRTALRGGRADRREPATRWTDVSKRIGERAWEELEPLLVEGEEPLAAASWKAVHGWRRRRRAEHLSCLAPAGAIVVSSDALLVVGGDPNALPRSPNFGINAVCVPFDALRAASLVDVTTSGPCVLALRLELGREGATETVLTPFPGEQLREVEDALARLAGRLALKEVRWSS